MSYHLLDEKLKPLPSPNRTKRKPAVKGEDDDRLFHYEIRVAVKKSGGKYQNIKKRYWLPDDAAAMRMEKQLRHTGGNADADAVTWESAFTQWLEANSKKSTRHIANVEATARRWYESMGAGKAVEGTTLGEFTAWLRERSKVGKGRGAQLDYAHLLAVARWCQENGIIEKIPFEHAPKPEDRTDERSPATIDEFHALSEILPEHISLLWQLLGMTGMRLGAACGLLEADIGEEYLTVTTKGEKRVRYPITAFIRDIIDKARAWKADRGLGNRQTLFCNVRGEPWTSRSLGARIDDIIQKRNKRAEKNKDVTPVPKVTAHQLRHLAGTILGEENFEVPGIMAALGHINPASTQVYVDKTQKMRDTAMATLAKKMTKKVTKNATENALSEVLMAVEELPKMTEGVDKVCPHCLRNILIKLKKEAQP